MSNLRRSNESEEKFYQELVELIDKHRRNVGALEMCAIAANMLGKIIALQDSRTHTASQIMEIVMMNIRLGNEQVVNSASGLQYVKPEGNA